MSTEIPLVAPVEWDSLERTQVRIAITLLDEFGLPSDRRAFVARLPDKRHPELFGAYADAVAKTVRNTIMLNLTGEEPK